MLWQGSALPGLYCFCNPGSGRVLSPSATPLGGRDLFTRRLAIVEWRGIVFLLFSIPRRATSECGRVEFRLAARLAAGETAVARESPPALLGARAHKGTSPFREKLKAYCGYIVDRNRFRNI